MEQDTRPYLTVKEIAARLRVTEWTIREWLQLGRIRGIKLGGAKAGWRVSESDLARFIASATPAEPPTA